MLFFDCPKYHAALMDKAKIGPLSSIKRLYDRRLCLVNKFLEPRVVAKRI